MSTIKSELLINEFNLNNIEDFIKSNLFSSIKCETLIFSHEFQLSYLESVPIVYSKVRYEISFTHICDIEREAINFHEISDKSFIKNSTSNTIEFKVKNYRSNSAVRFMMNNVDEQKLKTQYKCNVKFISY